MSGRRTPDHRRRPQKARRGPMLTAIAHWTLWGALLIAAAVMVAFQFGAR